MFSGIVETIGTIENITTDQECQHLRITSQQPIADIAIGESISVNGVCLTVTDFDNKRFHVTVVPETLRVTNLGLLQTTSTVNLERSVKVNDRISGHFVQGHVDATGEILAINHEGDAWLVKIGLPQRLARYIVNKGFVAIDGMSITIIEAGSNYFTVTFIPHTRDVTIVQNYQVGGFVNIEVDMLAKYLERITEVRLNESS